ncbi:3,5-dihydroxyphenylacetyl-CoA synthase DpgA [Streptomyces javensis]|uniref:3,5-dihydroxyphenylacetyl-CoA synthase DpgA n=1 Tax=Streptomyces javensis TaxID=114698 RepID=UPI0033C9D506
MSYESAEGFPLIIGAGTANPGTSYSQEDILRIYGIEDPKIRSLFVNSHIDRRFLSLPPAEPGRPPRPETQGELLRKHRTEGIELAAEALRVCLKTIGADLHEVDHLVCVTSTGFLTPGISARLIEAVGLPVTCGRLDVVGMGCNAGLNGLRPTADWAARNPGRLAVMVCVEVCSAAYVFDGSLRTAVVNSLFGDGAAAVALRAGGNGSERSADAVPKAAVRKFSSRIIPEASDAMRYDWDDEHMAFSFFLDREVPYVVGAHAEEAVDTLLRGTGIRRSEIAHWIVHSGGKKVIDAVKVNVGLTPHDLRHTSSVLRDYGNLSSGSFLFSYRQLMEERAVTPGDHGILMTMGPGSTIETALVQWQ